MKSLLVLFLLGGAVLPASAIRYTYGNLNTSKKTCSLTGWSGSQPSSGKLTLPDTYTHTDGVSYTVTSVAPHALDNLDAVTEIIIPASVVRIGDSDDYLEGVKNFNGCGMLERFIVASGNSNLAATGAGLLVSKDFSELYRVPQAMVSDELAVHSKVKYIAAGCFNGNTTIETLELPASVYYISPGAGFHEMSALAKITVASGNDKYMVDGGALIFTGRSDWELVAYPRARTIQNVTVSAKVGKIKEYAFANSKRLKSLTLPATVNTVEKYAFLKSSVTSVNLPSSLRRIEAQAFAGSALVSATIPQGYEYSYSDEGIFAGCHDLTSINVQVKNAVIPGNFALDCTSLASVTFASRPAEIGTAAFKGCKALKKFPFSASTDMSADSIFYGCGFEKVVFDSGEAVDSHIGKNMFSGCVSLKKIDLSSINIDREGGISVSPGFVTACHNLTDIRFPSNVWFGTFADGYTHPNIGPGVPLKKLVIGTFTVTDDCVVNYYMDNNTPDVYVLTTDSGRSTDDDYCPLNSIFTTSNGATVNPVFYCEAFAPMRNYLLPGASYYVPGKCLDNYVDAISDGCKVEAMYNIGVRNADGKLRMFVQADVPLAFTLTDVQFNDGAGMVPGSDGLIDSRMCYDDVETIRVNYVVNGVAMTTLYPRSWFDRWSGIATVEKQDGISMDIDGRSVKLAGADDFVWTVTSSNGRTVATGKGSDLDMSALAAGVYVVSAKGSAGSLVRKVVLN